MIREYLGKQDLRSQGTACCRDTTTGRKIYAQIPYFQLSGKSPIYTQKIIYMFPAKQKKENKNSSTEFFFFSRDVYEKRELTKF